LSQLDDNALRFQTQAVQKISSSRCAHGGERKTVRSHIEKQFVGQCQCGVAFKHCLPAQSFQSKDLALRGSDLEQLCGRAQRRLGRTSNEAFIAEDLSRPQRDNGLKMGLEEALL